MIVREMIDIRVPICKICAGGLGRIMVYRDDYKGHLYFCKDCGTEYKIIGQGQAENELLMEYEKLPDDITQRIRGNSGRYDPSRVVKEESDAT